MPPNPHGPPARPPDISLEGLVRSRRDKDGTVWRWAGNSVLLISAECPPENTWRSLCAGTRCALPLQEGRLCQVAAFECPALQGATSESLPLPHIDIGVRAEFYAIAMAGKDIRWPGDRRRKLWGTVEAGFNGLRLTTFGGKDALKVGAGYRVVVQLLSGRAPQC